MRDRGIVKLFKDISPANKLVVLVLLALFTVGMILIVRSFSKKGGQTEISQDQIKIQKGDDIVIINRNGLVEYRSKDKVFYRTWDRAKIDLFFASMEAKAREYLANPPSVGILGCYSVTLWLDGKIVTVCLADEDEELEEIFEEFEDEGSGKNENSLGDYFDDEDGNGWAGTATPTLTLPPGTTPTATPTPSDSGEVSPEDNYPPVEASCVTWSQDIVGKAIISNTLCTVED